METRDALILVHIETGLYFSKMADHTANLWNAKRFINQEQLDVWLQASVYAPDASEYTVETVDMTIERRINDVQEERVD